MYKAIWLVICLILIEAYSCFAQSNHKSHTYQYDGFSKLESKVLDTIINLPEVKTRAKYIRRRTNGKRNLQYIIWEKPTKENAYYWIRVMEDNGTAYHDHFDFFVYPKGFSIQFYEIANDTAITLSEWRKRYKK